jgi:hypothetical protein
MELSKIREKIKTCIDRIYKNDSDLFSRENYEVTISCKFAQYLHDEFPEYSVDCEYNRHIDGHKECEGQRIRPDIVIHKRGKDENNLVYIEIKTDHNRDDRADDINKIKCVTKQNGEYKYILGSFIDFNRDKEKLVLRFFENGEEVE